MFYLVIVNTLSGLLMLSSDKKGVSKINLNAAEVLIQRADRSQYGLREVCRALPSTADSSCFALMAGTKRLRDPATRGSNSSFGRRFRAVQKCATLVGLEKFCKVN